MLTGVSLVLWGLVLLPVGVALIDLVFKGGRTQIFLLGAVCVVLSFLYLRPHEMILSGQDETAYLGAGIRFAEEQALVFKDPLLAEIPNGMLDVFLLGDRSFGDTQFACFWIRDAEQGVLEPRFQPAFSLLMLPLGQLFGVYGAFLVTPFLSLLAILALYALCVSVLQNRFAAALGAGGVAFLPLWIGHARFVRPEVCASLLLVSGLTLAVQACSKSEAHRPKYWILASLAFGLAPFFHVIAWHAVILMGLFLLFRSASRDRGILAAVGILGVSVVLFILQTYFVTDPYILQKRVFSLLPSFVLWGGVVPGCLVGPILLAALIRSKAELLHNVYHSTFFSYGATAILLLLIGLGFVSFSPVEERIFSGHHQRLIFPTDLRVAAAYISWPFVGAAFTGLICLLISSKRPVMLFSCILFPSAFLVGPIYSLFLSRYLLITFMPLLGLGLAGLITTLKPCRVFSRGISIAVLLFLTGVGWRHHTPLVTTTNYKGFVSHQAEIADFLLREDALLFGEYSRALALFRHAYGIPTLSFDNETRDDYESGLDVWGTLIAEHPDQTPFFLTPFENPRSDHFSFELVHRYMWPFKRINGQRWGGDTGTVTGDFTLYLYEMSETKAPEPSRQWNVHLGQSNMGTSHFSRGRWSDWSVPAVSLASGSGLKLLGTDEKPLTSELQLIVMGSSESPPVLKSDEGTPYQVLSRNPLRGNWWQIALKIHDPLSSDTALSVYSSSKDAYLASAFNTHGQRLRLQGDLEAVSVGDAWYGRWSRKDSRLMLPSLGGREWRTAFLYAPPNGRKVTEVHLAGPEGVSWRAEIPSDQWSWVTAPVSRSEQEPDWRSYELQVRPIWNPDLPDYPTDLGVRVAGFHILPVQD